MNGSWVLKKLRIGIAVCVMCSAHMEVGLASNYVDRIKPTGSECILNIQYQNHH